MTTTTRYPITAEVSEQLRDDLDALAAREMTTRATVIRRAVRDYIQQHPPRAAAGDTATAEEVP